MTFTGELTRRFFSATSDLTFLLENVRIGAVDRFISGNPLSGSGQIVKFGLSGITGSNKMEFTFSGSKIYDPENRVCYCYNNDELLGISGSVSTGHYDYFINNNLVCSVGLTQNSDFNCWYVSTANSGSLECDVSIYGPEINIAQTNNNNFQESGFWTGRFTSTYDRPLVIHSGQLYGVDSMYFSGYSGLSFDAGNNILLPNTPKVFTLHNYSGSNKTGIFSVGLKLYGDFGVKDYWMTGASYRNTNPYYISNSILPENPLENLFVSGENGTSGFKIFNYNTLAELNGEPIEKNIYVHIDFVSGYTGNFQRITSYNITAAGSGYTHGTHSVEIRPTQSGFPYGYGVVLTNSNKGVTGILWQHEQTGHLGVYYSGAGFDSPSLFFPQIVGKPRASGTLTTQNSVKTFSGLIDVVTGINGTEGLSLKTLGQYNATKFSGFSTLLPTQENMFIKVIYNPLYDSSNLFFRVSVSGLQDTFYGTTGVYYESIAYRYFTTPPTLSHGEETRG